MTRTSVDQSNVLNVGAKSINDYMLVIELCEIFTLISVVFTNFLK